MQKFSEQSMNVNDVTRISQGASISGDINSSNDIRVDGTIDGTVSSEGKIVVGETAKLSGKLFCVTLDLWGSLSGDIYVKDTLSVKGTASVTGNIHVCKLQVEMGAKINGTCRMISEQEFDKFVSEIVKKKAPVASAAAAASPSSAKL